MPNCCVICFSACDANATAQNSLLSYPTILSVDACDKASDSKRNNVMQRASL